MIKSTELRIDNWLCHNGKYKQIASIHSDNTIRFILTDGCYGLGRPDTTPIPLSEEILLKAGFEKVDSVQQEGQNAYEIAWWGRVALQDGLLVSDEYNFFDGIQANVKYLHQLQNLFFALTNTELTINL